MPGTLRCRWYGRRIAVVGILAIASLVGACSGDGTEHRSQSTTVGPPFASTTVGSASEGTVGQDGISYDEAKDRSVLTADFDALVSPIPGSSASVIRLELSNTGRLADSYVVRLELDGDASAQVTPEMATLAAGADTTVEITVQHGNPSQISLVIESSGRDGAEVVRVPADWAG